MIKGVGHLDQCDISCLWPLEMSTKQKRFPVSNLGQLYILHSRLISRFLFNIGFSYNDKDYNKEIIDKYEKNWIKYDIKMSKNINK